jgi:tetratricopeptide (TPR) repeat protein
VFAARGRIYADQGKVVEALVDFDRALNRRPDDVATLLQRAQLHDQRGETDAALEDFNHAIQAAPQNTTALLMRGHFYEQHGQQAAALHDMDGVLALEPQNTAALATEARLLQQLGNLAGAQSALERLRQAQPTDAAVVLRQVDVLTQQKQYEQALALIRQALADGASPEPLYRTAGQLRYGMGEYGRALANYTAALNVQPENGAAYQGIGLAQRQLGNFPAAVVAFRQYLRLVPNAPDAAEIAAWVAKHSW